MSRKGNCLDNAVMENFFGHLKEEMFHHHEHAGIEAFTTDLKDYIRWYNTERISLTLECLSPTGNPAIPFCVDSTTAGQTRCTASGSCA